MSLLPPLPVGLALLMASLLLVFSHALPRRVPGLLAMATALACAALCLLMVRHTGDGALVTWFGGWLPRPISGQAGGQVLGVGFVVDRAGAAMGVLVGVLFAAALLFAWGYYDDSHAHFQALMLLFLAGMTGFVLTHDLFNLFVWFELMSVSAFALTGYRLEASALEGALTFTVVNTVGSYLILSGLGLLYAEVGALDFAALARGVAAAPGDPVVVASFVLLATGLLIKGAMVPFHFWLADAHAVAPSPVSVIFSGAMVSIGLFGIARLYWSVFAASPAVAALVHTLLLGMGVASAVLGGVMAQKQRHLKRMLAFSTIAHTGLMLIGLSLLSDAGTAGLFAYMAGHGLVKGALFMVAGVLLALCGGIDELDLLGQGGRAWPAGLAMALGGLLLAGLPWGTMDSGEKLIDAAAASSGRHWLSWPIALGMSLTGSAVLRSAARIFLGWGRSPGQEARAPTEQEHERADRPLWLMMLPLSALLLLALLPGDWARGFATDAVRGFLHPDAVALLAGHAPGPPPTAPPPAPAVHAWLPWTSIACAVLLAAWQLGRDRWPGVLVAATDWLYAPVAQGLERLHSGQVGDYLAWVAVGLALFGVVLALT